MTLGEDPLNRGSSHALKNFYNKNLRQANPAHFSLLMTKGAKLKPNIWNIKSGIQKALTKEVIKILYFIVLKRFNVLKNLF